MDLPAGAQRDAFEAAACANPISMRNPIVTANTYVEPALLNTTVLQTQGHIFACLLAHVLLLEMKDVRDNVIMGPAWPKLDAL